MDIDLEFLLPILMIGMMILIPIIGLTARFSLKPIVDAIVRLRETSTASTTEALLAEQRYARLEAEIHALRALLEPMAQRAEFDSQLYGGIPAPARRFPAASPVPGGED